jgi:DNA-binding winged helix-turn-helix (wHTH) protein
VRVKLHAQPLQVLLLLLERPGEMLTREEICKVLWPDGTFVDYEHGVNSAVNRLRDALGDKASSPRFVETLARRGYRFVAPVERIASGEAGVDATEAVGEADVKAGMIERVLATPEDLPKSSHAVVQTLFVLMQVNELISSLPHAAEAFAVMVVTAALLIPVRVFLLCAVLFHAPRIREKYRKIWWFLLPLDLLWSLAPFLLLHHINFGLALACMTPLIYSPFAQRALILMGAGEPGR